MKIKDHEVFERAGSLPALFPKHRSFLSVRQQIGPRWQWVFI